jgi:hypothetical protein
MNPPSNRTSEVHDLGYGEYYSDRLDVAWWYATFRPPFASMGTDRPDTLVHGQHIDPVEMFGQNAVMDLSDPRSYWGQRWQRFAETAPPGQPTLRDKIFGAPDNYGNFFRQFLQNNKLDVKTLYERGYRAVIGPEYLRGGRQLCMLRRVEGNTVLDTEEQLRVQGLMRPLSPLFDWEPPVHLYGQFWRRPDALPPYVPGQWKTVSFDPSLFPPSVRGGPAPARPVPPGVPLRSQFLVNLRSVSVNLALGLLHAYLEQKVNEWMFDTLMERVTPSILDRLEDSKAKFWAVQLLARGKRAWANVTITVRIDTNTYPEAQGAVTTRVLNDVKLTKVNVSDVEVNMTGPSTTSAVLGGAFSNTEYIPVTYSVELALPQDVVAVYAAMLQEMDWYEAARKNPALKATDVGRLTLAQKDLHWRFMMRFNDALDDADMLFLPPAPPAPAPFHPAPAPARARPVPPPPPAGVYERAKRAGIEG